MPLMLCKHRKCVGQQEFASWCSLEDCLEHSINNLRIIVVGERRKVKGGHAVLVRLLSILASGYDRFCRHAQCNDIVQYLQIAELCRNVERVDPVGFV